MGQLTEINIPLKFRITGEMGDIDFEELEQRLVSVLQKRISVAQQTISTDTYTLSQHQNDEVMREHYKSANHELDHDLYDIPSYEKSGASEKVRIRRMRRRSTRRRNSGVLAEKTYRLPIGNVRWLIDANSIIDWVRRADKLVYFIPDVDVTVQLYKLNDTSVSEEEIKNKFQQDLEELGESEQFYETPFLIGHLGDLRVKSYLERKLGINLDELLQNSRLPPLESIHPKRQNQYILRTYASFPSIIEAFLVPSRPVAAVAANMTKMGDESMLYFLARQWKKKYELEEQLRKAKPATLAEEDFYTAQLEELVRLNALEIMARHRAAIIATAEHMFAPPEGSVAGSKEKTNSAIQEIRKAADFIYQLENIKEELEGYYSSLDSLEADTNFHRGDPDKLRNEIWENCSAYMTEDEYIVEFERLLDTKRGARSEGNYWVYLRAYIQGKKLWREKQLFGINKSLHEAYKAYPIFSELDAEDIVELDQPQVSKQNPNVGLVHLRSSRTSQLTRYERDKKVLSAAEHSFYKIIEKIDEAIRLIAEKDDIHPFDMPKAIEITRANLPGPLQDLLDKTVSEHVQNQFWKNMIAAAAWTAAEVAICFIPVVGPGLALVVGSAALSFQLEDMLDRKVLEDANISPSENVLGVGVSPLEYVMLGIGVILVAHAGVGVVRAIRGDRWARTVARMERGSLQASRIRPTISEGSVLVDTPEGTIIIDIQAGTPFFLSSRIAASPGSRGIMLESGDWLIGYQKVTTINQRDLELARVFVRNMPHWPQGTSGRFVAMGDLPEFAKLAPDVYMNPRTRLFPQRGPVTIVEESFFPAKGKDYRAIPKNQQDVASLTKSTHPQLHGLANEIYWRRPFGLKALTYDSETIIALGRELNSMLRQNGFVEFRLLRALDRNIVERMATQIPGSRIVDIDASTIRRFLRDGTLPSDSPEVARILRNAEPDLRREFPALGEGDIKAIMRIYKTQE